MARHPPCSRFFGGRIAADPRVRWDFADVARLSRFPQAGAQRNAPFVGVRLDKQRREDGFYGRRRAARVAQPSVAISTTQSSTSSSAGTRALGYTQAATIPWQK